MIKLDINQEELDKLSIPDLIAMEGYFTKCLKDGYYSAQCDIDYCIAVKHMIRNHIMEWTSIIYPELL